MIGIGFPAPVQEPLIRKRNPIHLENESWSQLDEIPALAGQKL